MNSADSITLVMLPGLDGTGMLFTPLLREFPEGVEPVIISYPVDRVLSYSQLVSYVENMIPDGRKVVILAESFSGPVSIALAVSGRIKLSGLILCSTFIRNPRPFLTRLFSMLPLFSIMGSWFPGFLIRAALLGGDASDELIGAFRSAVKSVKPAVLSQRFKEISCVNMSDPLKGIAVPVCVIKGSYDMLVPEAALPVPEEAELHVIEGPHLLLQARAKESAGIIRGFLEKL
jgi:pimeloyl-ACP methyl ester carboxylesterase